MTDNVLPFDGETTGPVSVDAVLNHAKHLDEVLVLGWEPDGTFYAASSSGNIPLNVDLVERFKFMVYSNAED